MSWALIDDKVLTHPKMQRAEAAEGDAAWTLWSKALVYVRLHQLDGVVPGDMLGFFVRHKSPAKIATTLVRVGLWEQEGENYRIHDYHDVNDTKEQVEAKRKESRERMQRRRGVRANNGEQGANTDEQPTDVRDGSERVQTPEPYRTEPNRTEPTRSGEAAAPAAAPVDPVAGRILADLRLHPSLEPVATPRLAESLAGRVMGKGSKPEWISAAIADLARDAQAASDVHRDWSPEHLAKMAAKYVDNAKAPKPEAPKPGEDLTPEQDRAIRAKRGVQQGSAGPAGDGNALIEAMLREQGVTP